MVVLDTDYIVRLRAGDQDARAVAAELEAKNLPTRVPTIVIGELYTGVGAGDDPVPTQDDYEALLANKPVVGLDENIARRAGVLNGYHQQHETKPNLGIADAIVAATGLTLNEAVVSTDSDFERVDALAFEKVSASGS